MFPVEAGGKELSGSAERRTRDQIWYQANSYNASFTHAHEPNMERVVLSALLASDDASLIVGVAALRLRAATPPRHVRVDTIDKGRKLQEL